MCRYMHLNVGIPIAYVWSYVSGLNMYRSRLSAKGSPSLFDMATWESQLGFPF